ncbi:MAG: hypothetical protein M0Z60_03525 [Nitrospiraceae bacterium]|nr:hypothetical protein [Nitrospiraceae bacterium]
MRKKSISIGLFLAGSLVLAGVGRAAAATITVSNLNDSGAGSLRQAIASASPGDTIGFGVTGDITLTSGELLIDKDITISGPGSASLFLNGTASSRVLEIAAGSTATISGLTIQNGHAPLGEDAGGIWNNGTCFLSNVVVRNNHTSGQNYDVGGGILNQQGAMTLDKVTVSGNSAYAGGGIFNAGESIITITNSAISGNGAFGAGGGLDNYGTASVSNTTISSNSSGWSGAVSLSGPGETTQLLNVTINGNTGIGLDKLGTANLSIRNSIVSNNSDGDCWDAVPSDGYNISSDDSCGFASIGDLPNTDPRLGPLADNGGPTMTHALLTGSPAIDKADPRLVLPTDQRGVARPQGPRGDIGAYEYLPVSAVPAMNTWGLILFVLSAGAVSVYYMRKRLG